MKNIFIFMLFIASISIGYGDSIYDASRRPAPKAPESPSYFKMMRARWSGDYDKMDMNQQIANSLQINERLQKKSTNPLNKLNEHGLTPLMDAALKNDATGIYQLMEDGANPNIYNGRVNALLLATYHQNFAAVKALVTDVEIDLDARNSDGYTALYIACDQESVPVAETLLARGANPAVGDNSGRTPLQISAVRGDLKLVKLIVHYARIYYASGVLNIINYRSKREAPALINAVRNGREEIANFLLENGADPDLTDEFGETALHFAAMNNHPRLVKLLLRYGANPDIKNNKFKTPLDVANGYFTKSALRNHHRNK